MEKSESIIDVTQNLIKTLGFEHTDEVKTSLKTLSDNVIEQLNEDPVRTIGIAFSLGFALTNLLRTAGGKDIQKKLKYPGAAKDEQGRLRVGAAVGIEAIDLEGPGVREVIDAHHGPDEHPGQGAQHHYPGQGPDHPALLEIAVDPAGDGHDVVKLVGGADRRVGETQKTHLKG